MARFHRFLGTQKRRSRQFSFRSDGDSRKKRLELVALWGVPIGLTLLSGVLIASTQRGTDTVKWYYHWATGIIGLEAALLIARSKLIEWIKDWLDLLYFLTIASLLAVRFVGISALGAQRWINIAGLHVQPSEFA
ncbi:MAG TPA: FtsW/RodA/SpoVE family cell cycle protein, partial [Prochlorococcaceae cyanobacterium AMR_MDS_5431]|nr:FtsW/RodA/SpoVE family cell cycle protein [Prochlorococcaceae cyanobacterium AMR_MDS_5431]